MSAPLFQVGAHVEVAKPGALNGECGTVREFHSMNGKTYRYTVVFVGIGSPRVTFDESELRRVSMLAAALPPGWREESPSIACDRHFIGPHGSYVVVSTIVGSEITARGSRADIAQVFAFIEATS